MTTLFDLLFVAALFVPPITVVVCVAALAFGRRRPAGAPVLRRAA